jgi:hypothetical protein
MALMKTTILESGLVIPEAYYRVQGINGNKDIVTISIEVFVSKSLCEEQKLPVSYMSFNFIPSQEENALRWDKQAYEYLKTLEEFAGSVDV